MAEMLALAAQPRDAAAKARALRRRDLVPGIMYGPGYMPCLIQFEELALTRMVLQAGTSRLISVIIDGDADEHIALIREVQRDPVTNDIVHIDFYHTVAGQALTSSVPLVGVGVAPGLEEVTGSSLGQLLDSVEIECLPKDMPVSISYDLTLIEDLSSMITVADLVIPAGVTILTPVETEVAHLVAQRAEEPEPGLEEAIEGEEGVMADVDADADADADTEAAPAPEED